MHKRTSAATEGYRLSVVLGRSPDSLPNRAHRVLRAIVIAFVFQLKSCLTSDVDFFIWREV